MVQSSRGDAQTPARAGRTPEYWKGTNSISSLSDPAFSFNKNYQVFKMCKILHQSESHNLKKNVELDMVVCTPVILETQNTEAEGSQFQGQPQQLRP